VTLYTSQAVLAQTLPSREELREMFRTPGVLVAAIIASMFVLLGALTAITILALNDHGTEAIGGLLLGILGLVVGQLRGIQRQTNGTQTRLLDAALSSTGGTGGQGGEGGGTGGQGGAGGRGTDSRPQDQKELTL